MDFIFLFSGHISTTVEKAENTTNFTPYDYSSILHYGKHTYSRHNPLTVFQVRYLDSIIITLELVFKSYSDVFIIQASICPTSIACLHQFFRDM